MNIILLTCVSGTMFQRSIGAYQLAHFLRDNGYTVQVIDFTDHFTTDELCSALDKFTNNSTLCIGISSTFYNNFNVEIFSTTRDFKIEIPSNLEDSIKYIKEKYPKVKLVLGGAKSLAGNSIPWIDCVIHGHGEDKMLNYVNGLAGKNTNKIISFSKSIDVDPIDKKFNIEKLSHRFIKEDNILQGEVLPIEISRGCIFKCKFCSYPLIGKTKLDYLRDANLIKEEMQFNYDNYGTTSYFFGDDTFNDSTIKISKLHEAITSLPFKINFTCYLRLDLLHRYQEQIPMLEEMGLVSPFFGIESLNQKSATSIGKGMNTEKVKEFLLDLYHNKWKGKLPIYLSFIVGLPHETKETLQETFDWVSNTDFAPSFQPLSIFSDSIYKSEFELNIEKYGYNVDPVTRQWSNDNFTQKEAENLAKTYNERVLYKNSKPASWFLMTLLNHNMTLDECKSINISDINWKQISFAKYRKVNQYKKLILKS